MKFVIESLNDFKGAVSHQLEVFELPFENLTLKNKNTELTDFLNDFDYFFRVQAITVSSEFKAKNKST